MDKYGGIEQSEREAIRHETTGPPVRRRPGQIDPSAARAGPLFGLAVLLLGLALAYRPAQALVITVDGAAVSDGTNGICSLFEAIQNADAQASNPDCAGGTPDKFVEDIIVLPAATVYTLPSTLPDIRSKITIEGNGSTIRRDPTDPNRFRLIYMPGGSNSGHLTLNNLTLSGGYDDFTEPIPYGGGAIVTFGNFLILNNCLVTDNTSTGEGGAITGSTEVTINNSVLSYNVSHLHGGAINAGQTHRLNNTTLIGNVALGEGGGIATKESAPIFLTDSLITDNEAGLDGGGVYSHSGATVLRTTISNNSAVNGGGVYVPNGGLNLNYSTVRDNAATASGGGVWSTRALNVAWSAITGNTSGDDGGGVFHIVLSDVTGLHNSTLSGNTAGRYGGGIHVSSATTASVYMQNMTITGNSASRGGGLDLVNNVGGLTRRSIIAGNSAPLGREAHVTGSPPPVNWYNIFGHSGDAGLVGLTPGSPWDLVPALPLAAILDPALGNNGGPTQTHALVTGSPAIDMGASSNCASVPLNLDQRGLPRNIDANGVASTRECDSGSFEAQGIFPTPTATSSPTPVPTDTPTPVPTDTPTPTPTDTPVPTDTPTPTPTDTPVPTDTPTPTPTNTAVPTDTPTASPTATASPTPVPTDTPTPMPTDTPMPTPTDTPTPPPIVFSGFFAPVNNPPVVNSAKGGSAIPVKFNLGGDFGLSVFEGGYPGSQRIACDGGAPIDPIEETVTAGASGLQYDPDTGQYTYVWKTQKSWGGTCRQLILRFSDGAERVALFNFK